MNWQEKFDLIKRNTQEIVGEDELKAILKERDLNLYWGIAITGRPHIGYFTPAMKIRDFLNAGVHVKILLADLHALIDDMKTPFKLLDARFEYYKLVITALLEATGTDTTKLTFVQGRSFELKPEYMLDLLKIAANVSLNDCKRAAAEVVRLGEHPKLGGFIYPIMQALDEEYLGVDAQFGGADQRKIFMFAREKLPLLGYKSRVEIMTPMVPGLTGGKMSSSEKDSKIDLIDSPEAIKQKMNKAFCPVGEVEGNGVLAFAKHVVMHLKEDHGESLVTQRPEKFGGPMTFRNYAELEKAFLDKSLHPMDLKAALAEELIKYTKPIRDVFVDKQDLIKKAYP